MTPGHTFPRREPFIQPLKDFSPGRSITLNVAQGLDSILWAYQKFAPYFDNIHFNVLAPMGGNPSIQGRSLPWLELLPGVTAELKRASQGYYSAVTSRACTMKEVWQGWKAKLPSGMDYCCDVWLEAGFKLRDIDPESTVLDVIPFTPSREPHTPPFERYAMLYVAEMPVGGWSMDQWSEYVRRVFDRWNVKLPVVMVSNDPYPFDPRGIVDRSITQQDPRRVIDLIRGAAILIGCHSGLSVVADSLGTPQMCFYPEPMKDMQYGWCRPEHEGTVFHADLYTHSPETVAQNHDLSFLKKMVAKPVEREPEPVAATTQPEPNPLPESVKPMRKGDRMQTRLPANAQA